MTAEPDEPARGHGPLVLVVDDDYMIRRLVRTVLETDAFDVVEAADGEAALRLAVEQHPSVVVLDVKMPGIDGVEVCRRMDRDDARVVVLTGGDRCLEGRCRDAGADAFLTKPFSAGELVDLVTELSAPSA